MQRMAFHLRPATHIQRSEGVLRAHFAGFLSRSECRLLRIYEKWRKYDQGFVTDMKCQNHYIGDVAETPSGIGPRSR